MFAVAYRAQSLSALCYERANAAVNQEDSRDKDSCDEDSRDGGSQMSSRRGLKRNSN